jgi:hypothetical protein
MGDAVIGKRQKSNPRLTTAFSCGIKSAAEHESNALPCKVAAALILPRSMRATPYLWDTSEVTRVWAALRTNAVWQKRKVD